MSFNYVSYAYKPTTIGCSASGNFTSPSDINLIMCKNQYLQVNRLSEEGVSSVVEFEAPGRIDTMSLFRPSGEKQDLLFITIEDTFFTLGFIDGKIETLSSGSIDDPVGRRSESGSITTIDPLCRAVALSIYEGLLKIIPFENNKHQFKEAFNVRLEELNVIDIAFLESLGSKSKSGPTFALLYQDHVGSRHVKTYEVKTLDKDMEESSLNQLNVDHGANILIPVPAPLGGVICVGEAQVSYINESNKNHSVASPANSRMAIRSYGKLDNTRWFLGDQSGQLYLLSLQVSDSEVTGLTLKELGVTSISSCISYLDNGYVFIGSNYGDSQVIRISDELNPETNSYFEVFQTYSNIGPIVDFCFVDADKQGQGQIVTCSGAFKDGSLRIIKNGIGIEELTTISDLVGLNRIWSLKTETGEEKYLVMSFTGQTLISSVDNEEIGEAKIPGFDVDSTTVLCDTVIGNNYLQVTDKTARLVSSHTLELIDEWKPSSGTISLAASNPTQLVVSLGEGKLVYIEISAQSLKQIQQTKLDYEVSCIDISPEEGKISSTVCAVGMWTEISVRVLTLPSFDILTVQELGGEILPRSILMPTFEGINYLMCGLGDGHLFTFKMDRGMGILTDKKRIVAGSKPIMLRPFISKDRQLNVFAASERPTIIYSRNQKLVYSNVNLGEVNDMCSFNHESFPFHIAIANENSILIGQIDEIQKLHIKTVQLHAQPTKICHQPSTKAYGLLITQFENPETSAIFSLDENNFEKKSEIRLEGNELGQSIISCKFTDDDNEYFIVGTAITEGDEEEPSKGRILVLQVQDDKLVLKAEKDVKGAVMVLHSFNGKLLAGVSGRLMLFKWAESDDGDNKDLVQECSCSGGIYILDIDSHGDFILIGDMMKSVHLFVYENPEEQHVSGNLRLISKDYQYSWLSCSLMLNESEYVAVDQQGNMITLKKNDEAASEEERKQLVRVGKYYCSDRVNRIQPGFIGMRFANSSSDINTQPVKTALFGTISGGIGVLAQLPPETFAFVTKIQKAMSSVVTGLANISRETYRQYRSERTREDSVGFIDGDFVESFLEFDFETQQRVIEELSNNHQEQITLEELVKNIEDLSHLIH
ncbi:damage-specific DNA binding protein 1 [Naegleria gruberi]|uniref:DNA damage-binding protein 1 n=1 Tax=Naegleria gruberi TaxID=5762 RepID=D2V2C4_NAEGR|nr:damage-specific DNA binding protein 1 [Naegleria gruberi]EFC49032.1 damage-specific DNA binding protein 1 [Naegleria gruberi]|eukprot:XP_002681776.1 damage-specific DNA binding protein 1 [Naegleria gruberi strain NEG-M]